MSAQTIDFLKEVFEAFSAGDLDRILRLTHPEFEGIVPPELSAEPDSYRGHEGVRRYFETFYEAMDEIRFEPRRFWDAGDVVVVWVRMTARGKQTSIPVEQRFAQIWTVRDDLAKSAQTYRSLAEALRAAGLPPSAADTPSQ